MACSNPIAINNGTVNNFGFTTVFNPYNKTVTFDTSGLSTFDSIFGVSASFEVTDPEGNVVGDLSYGALDSSIDIGAGDSTLTLSLLVSGVLIYGNYTIKSKIWTDSFISNDLQFDVTVCQDNRLETSNFIKGCITVDTNCATAKMVIKEQTNLKYNGMSPISKTSSNTVTYPDNYIAQKTFTTIPYSLDLNGSITGLYQVKVNTTARYELTQCNCYIDVKYISQWADNVTCSGALATLMCCWTQSLEIAQKGGVSGQQMQDKLDEALPIFNKALLLEFNAKDSSKTIKQLQELLGCDCGCQKGLTIQANPITFGTKNIVGSCGTSVTEDGDEITISSYNVVIAACNNADGFEFSLETNGCNKNWCLAVDFSVIAQNVIQAIEDDEDAILYWQTVLGINSCPCKSNVLWLSQNNAAPSETNNLNYSQITVCGGSVITFPTVQTATSLDDVVTYLNTHIKVLAGVFTYVASGGSNLFSLTTDETGIQSSYVPTDGACTFMVYLYQSCTSVVIVNGTPLIMDVVRLSTYYKVLSTAYFTKSDVVETINLQDASTITGGSLGTIDIVESTTGGSATISTLGEAYALDAGSQCGAELVVKSGTITQNTKTSLGCTASEQQVTSYERVPYSERYTFALRYNPQINDLPYSGDYIYLANSSSSSNDTGSVIRMYNTVTKETMQIAGVTGLATPPSTSNNVWGDVVQYYYATSVYVDRADINNGQPTIYFMTYGGVLCKLVRERSNQCDERANWKNYVLAGANSGSVTSNPQTGTNARFSTPYGMKRMGTVNGQPSFLVYNSGAGRLDFVYYKLVSGANDSANWYVETSPLTAPSRGGNINIDRETWVSGDTTYTNIPVIYIFGAGKITKTYYIGSETSASDMLNGSNYTTITVIDQSEGSSDGLGNSSATHVHSPFFLSKITYNGNDTFVFCEEYAGGAPPGLSKLRGFYASTTPTNGAEDFTFITIVPDNAKVYSTFGYATSGSGTPTANGVSCGIFYHPTKAKYFEFSFLGGIRTFCPNLNVTQATILYANESGADALAATVQDTTQIVDTNYRLKIT